MRAAFADSLKTIWYALIAFSVAGLVSTVLMKEIEMGTLTDEQWGVREKTGSQTPEKEVQV